MDSKFLVTMLIISGFLLGMMSSQLTQKDSSKYCNKIEQNIRQNQSFNGSLACYPPGVLDVNLSERVDNNAKLKCVCRIIDRNGVRLFPVAISNQ